MWVRGLKLCNTFNTLLEIEVAPYVGAWIETLNGKPLARILWSHPMWVRGLKPIMSTPMICRLCRTLCGCVD